MSIEPLWRELERSALLGAERAGPLPPPPAPLAAAWEAITAKGGSCEAALLDRIALAALYRRAGSLPPAALGSAAEAPADPRPPLGEAAMAHLFTLLESRERLLPEWLALAERAGGRLPERHLPVLLDRAREDVRLRPLLARLGGERARWLSGLNPAWAGLAAEGDLQLPESLWGEGSLEQRAAFLLARRRRDPEGARALLESAFGELPARERARLLPILGERLAAADEPFLTRALADRGREVRQIAADLLARLPDSALSQRHAERLAALVQLEKGWLRTTLTIEPPAEWPADWGRDGIEQQPPHGRGARGYWLEQLVARVPPAFWSRYQLPPGQLLQLAQKSDWAKELWAGWYGAVLRFGDPAWARALFEAGVRPRELLPHLPVTDREALLENSLAQEPQLAWPLADSLADQGPWSERLGRRFLSVLPALVQGWHRGLLESGAAQLPPALLPELERCAGALNEATEASLVAKLLETVRLRMAIHKALAQEGGGA